MKVGQSEVCVSTYGMGTQEKKKKMAVLSPTQCAQFRVEIQSRGVNTNAPLGICVAEKLLNPTILSFLLYKMGVVITSSSCDYYEDKNERTKGAELRSWHTVKPSINVRDYYALLLSGMSLYYSKDIYYFSHQEKDEVWFLRSSAVKQQRLFSLTFLLGPAVLRRK